MYEIFVDGLSIGIEELTLNEAKILDSQDGILVKKVQ